MEGQYGIIVTNKFNLLEDEEDILDSLHKQEEAKKLEKAKGIKIEKPKVTKVLKKTINTTTDKRTDNSKSGYGYYIYFKHLFTINIIKIYPC